jgi:regulator of protease activity HflC (stomatin/prohibitin superfamily)
MSAPLDHDHDTPADAATPGSGTALPQAPLDPADESLQRALLSGFRVLRWLMLVLIVLYLASGGFSVKPTESGLVVRFGKLLINRETRTPVFPPGWHVGLLPDPFDTKLRISNGVQQLVIDTFCFRRRPEDLDKRLAEVDTVSDQLIPGVDGALFTGDKNLSHALWTVQYRITDPAKFVQRVGDNPAAGEPLLRRAAESTIVRTVASRRIEDVLLAGQARVAQDVQERLQHALDALEVGLTVQTVLAEVVEPRPVKDAFAAVTRAENAKVTAENNARKDATTTLTEAAGGRSEAVLALINEYAQAPEPNQPALLTRIDAELAQAGGNVSSLLSQANAEGTTTLWDVKREYDQFSKLLARYQQSPETTRLTLWVEMLHTVLGSKSNDVLLVPLADTIEIVTNRDQMLAAQRERERVQQQMQGAGGGGPPPGPPGGGPR